MGKAYAPKTYSKDKYTSAGIRPCDKCVGPSWPGMEDLYFVPCDYHLGCLETYDRNKRAHEMLLDSSEFLAALRGMFGDFLDQLKPKVSDENVEVMTLSESDHAMTLLGVPREGCRCSECVAFQIRARS